MRTSSPILMTDIAFSCSLSKYILAYALLEVITNVIEMLHSYNGADVWLCEELFTSICNQFTAENTINWKK